MQRRELLKLGFASLLVALAPKRIRAGLNSDSDLQTASQRMHLTVSNVTDLSIWVRVSDSNAPEDPPSSNRELYPGYDLQDKLLYGCLVEFLTYESAATKATLRYDFVAGIHSERTRTIEFSHDSNIPGDFLISERIGVNQSDDGDL